MFIKIIDFKSVLHTTYRMTCQIQAPGATHREEAQKHSIPGELWLLLEDPQDPHLSSTCLPGFTQKHLSSLIINQHFGYRLRGEVA